MTTVRLILNRLNIEAIRRLIDHRGLGRSKSLREMRGSISRSYRGEVASLLDDLLKKELIQVFSESIPMGEGWIYLSSPSSHDLRELLDFAKKIFVRGQIPDSFEFEPSLLDDPSEDDEEGDAIGEDGDGADKGDEEDTEAETIDADAKEEPFAEIGEEWTRPLKIRRVLLRLGMDAPRRLRTSRFHGLLEELSVLGLEAKEADSDEPFSPRATSPGIDVKIRLRRRAESPSAANPTVGVVVVPREPKQRPKRRLPPWEMALTRLRFLTAIPDATRELQADWPDGYVDAATHGLELPPDRVQFLRTVATGFVRGDHDPFIEIQALEGALEGPEWSPLLEQWRKLNRNQASAVEFLAARIESLVGLSANSVAKSDEVRAPSSDRPVPISSVEPLASGKDNARYLGALKNLFD